MTSELILTRPEEFVKFITLLMSDAPKGYSPWLFPVQAGRKDPDGAAIAARAGPISSCCSAPWIKVTKTDAKGKKTTTIVCEKCGMNKGSWKAKYAQLTIKEAIERLKQGLNVGIAARADDPLLIMDIDDINLLNKMPGTLTIRSRKRTGLHGFFWIEDKTLKRNTTTDFGEIRAVDQFVIAAGSYVPITDKDLEEAVRNE